MFELVKPWRKAITGLSKITRYSPSSWLLTRAVLLNETMVLYFGYDVNMGLAARSVTHSVSQRSPISIPTSSVKVVLLA